MSDIVVVAGGNCELSLYRDILSDAFLIGADRGALYLVDNGYRVDMAVGDFDSVSETEMERIRTNSVKIDRLSAQKDETDLEYAIKCAHNIPGTIHILGATGSRLDQTMSAINLLKLCHDGHKDAYIYDKNNRIRLTEGHTVIRKSRYRYVSLIPYEDTITGVSLKGFKYSGENITLERKTSLGISNEITEDEAQITCRGYVFVFETED